MRYAQAMMRPRNSSTPLSEGGQPSRSQASARQSLEPNSSCCRPSRVVPRGEGAGGQWGVHADALGSSRVPSHRWACLDGG